MTEKQQMLRIEAAVKVLKEEGVRFPTRAAYRALHAADMAAADAQPAQWTLDDMIRGARR